MPASMISAPTGGRPKVTGSSMVMVAMGPIPGSTPISVPTRQPRKHSPRLWRLNATEKPSARLCSSAVISERQPAGQHEDRNRKVEEAPEEPDADQGGGHRVDRQLPPAGLGRGRPGDEHRQRTGYREPRNADGERKGHHRQGDQHGAAHRPLPESLPLPEERQQD